MLCMRYFPRTPLVFFLTVASVFAVAAQDSVDVDRAKDFYDLTKAAPKAFNDGEFDRARSISEKLLEEAKLWERDWNYGNAIHVGNLVLGRIALKDGKTDDAKKFLLAAGRTPGSPTLNSFGPDMLFASEMLKAGEKDVVFQYFSLCAVFWNKKFSKVAEWRSAIERGETPNFGANVAYVFGSVR